MVSGYKLLGGASSQFLKTGFKHLVVNNKDLGWVLLCVLQEDQMCCARAIAVCMAALNGEKNYRYLAMKSRLHSRAPSSATGRGIKLMEAVNLPVNVPVLLKDLCKFEDHLNVQIIVVSGDHNDLATYTGSRTCDRKIYL